MEGGEPGTAATPGLYCTVLGPGIGHRPPQPGRPENKTSPPAGDAAGGLGAITALHIGAWVATPRRPRMPI